MSEAVLLADVVRLVESDAALALHDVCTEYHVDPAQIVGLDDDFLALQLRWGLLYRHRTRPKAEQPRDEMGEGLARIEEAKRVLGGS